MRGSLLPRARIVRARAHLPVEPAVRPFAVPENNPRQAVTGVHERIERELGMK